MTNNTNPITGIDDLLDLEPTHLQFLIDAYRNKTLALRIDICLEKGTADNEAHVHLNYLFSPIHLEIMPELLNIDDYTETTITDALETLAAKAADRIAREKKEAKP